MTTPVMLWLGSLPLLLVLGVAAWAVSTVRRNVGLVDIFWSLFLLLGLTTAWAIRLASYLAARNWNAPEDHRYRAIRARNEPGFTWKSAYLVFGLQAVLAWLISAPLAAAIALPGAAGLLGWAGAALAAFGIAYESVADRQLTRFKAQAENAGQVMDQGLWRYSRHPNYFGEFCVWWGLYLLAADAGGWWTLFSPLLMSVLLLRVSGVALLEKDIGERRPAYQDYMCRTRAFIPGPPREA
jgi:steroid 5-alpha reductase family enzyme